MGTLGIVLVSVFSTLCVSVLVTAIVVMYVKLKGKVGVREMDNVYRGLEEINTSVNTKIRETEDHLTNRLNDIDNHIGRNFDDIRRNIDSRCDKLNDKIKRMDSDTSKKQILTD